MTTVTQIITDAFRQGNITAVGATPTELETAEALRYLNRIVKSVFGAEAGEPLQAFPLGATNVTTPAGYPWYGDTPGVDWFVPKNSRLMLNLSAPQTVALHPLPDNGSRFAVIDVTGNLATNTLTVQGNGRLIEGATEITLNTNSVDQEWFYREDTANWAKYAPLLLDDIFPFPEEFDDFFITMLSVRLNPAYGIALDGQSQAVLARSKQQLQARYSQTIPTPVEIALIRLSRMSADRDQWENYWPYDSSVAFNRGWPF